MGPGFADTTTVTVYRHVQYRFHRRVGTFSCYYLYPKRKMMIMQHRHSIFKAVSSSLLD
jgi:hypothetical protein